MKFWKEHVALRFALMAVTFVAGLALLIGGWGMTGKMAGLLIMLVGIALLLTTLALYNKPFEEPKTKTKKAKS